jgi:hypothetical protein
LYFKTLNFMITKKTTALGFDLDELSGEMSRYDQEKTAPQQTKTGRPRTLHGETVSLSVRITDEQRQWLIQEAARTMLETGRRQDVSQLVRDLIDDARREAKA